MKPKKRELRRMKTKHASFVRASISFTPALYAGLDDIARQKKVSIAWVVRDAAEKYIAAETRKTGKVGAGGFGRDGK
jgi:hypothetical protein